MNHTPGPWRAAIGDDYALRKGEEKNEVAVMPHAGFDAVNIFVPQRETACPHGCDFEEFKANCLLVAAAPTLFDYVMRRAKSGDAEAAALLESINAKSE